MAVVLSHRRAEPNARGNEWVREEIWPILDTRTITDEDLLHTLTHWLEKTSAYGVSCLDEVYGSDAGAIPFSGDDAGAMKGTKSKAAPRKILLTGGGSHNTYLVSQLRASQDETHPSFEFIVEDSNTTDFKEAALIALAALFRAQGIPNALVSATGAERPTVNGALFHP